MEEIKLDITHRYDYTEDVNPEKINQVVKDGFGCGTDITLSIGNKQNAILNYDKLQAEGLLAKDTYSDRSSYKIDGSSYVQVTEDINTAFGLTAEGKKFNSTLNVATNRSMSNTDDYEYGIRVFLGKALGVTLESVTDLSRYVEDRALHDIAGIEVNGRVEYPTNDKNKLKELFTHYGTHIITKAIFGCKYVYYYMRESINQETNIQTQVDCNLNLKFNGNEKGLGELGVNLGQDYGEAYTSCSKSGSKKEFFDIKGGGELTSFEDWESGMDFLKPETISLVGYVMPGTTNDIGLVPLWDIVSDSVRVQKLKDAYDEYLKENTPQVRRSKVVLVDVFGRHFDKNVDAPSTITEPDRKGVIRKYKRLSEEIMQHVKGSKKGSFYFYYTTAYATAGGLSEVKFGNKKDTYESPWEKRGSHANEGVTGCLDDNIVLIKPADRSNYPSTEAYENDLIAGFGVNVKGVKRISDDSDVNFNWVTGGCEWYKGGLVHDEVRCIYTKEEKIAVDEQK